MAEISRLIGRPVGFQRAGNDMTLERGNSHQGPLVLCGPARRLVDHKSVCESWHLVVGHVGKISKSERIRERTMLGKPLLVIAPLDVMKTTCVAAVIA